MPTNRLQLSEMIDQLRAELGLSTNVAQGVNSEDGLKHVLRRTQRELWTAYEWDQLLVDEIIDVSASARYIALPALIDYERIKGIWCSYGSEWRPVGFGIGPAEYSAYPIGTESWPVERYRYWSPTGQLELWPVPSQVGQLYVTGTQKLAPLVESSDTSLLDGTAVVLFAAAELAAKNQHQDAPIKLQKARDYLRTLRGNITGGKRPVFSMLPADGGRRPRAGLDYIPPGWKNG